MRSLIAEAAETGRDGVHAGFVAAAARHPDRPALEVEERVVSYAELFAEATRFAATFESLGTGSLVGVFARRSVTTYAATLGVLMSGRGVVPLNPSFPAQRTAAVIEQAELDVVAVDVDGAAEMPAVSALAQRQISVVGADQRSDAATWEPRPADPDAIAYLMFTSGSTGQPKGVPLLHRNIAHFIHVTSPRYTLSEADRFSQFYEVTFDSSLFDLYIAWRHAACLCCPKSNQLLNPAKFIHEKQLTVVDMVPSTAHVMQKMGALKPGSFPNLRVVRLGGEAVSAELAQAWAAAAPAAVVENNYGPSEATVDVISYCWDRAKSLEEAEHGVAPIGYAYPGADPLVVNELLEEVAIGEEGELLVTGPQIAPGYWKDAERTARSFINPPGRTQRYYRTGDLVRRPAAGKPFVFRGRNDHQVKIFGVRIELGEVEAALREAAGTSSAVAVGWPIVPSGAGGIVAFLDKMDADVKAITAQLKTRLANVMVPRQIRLLEQFPLNANGKIDRHALVALLR
jgi:amino acid adenylation domain-containing protein